jgi:hypothetical protein
MPRDGTEIVIERRTTNRRTGGPATGIPILFERSCLVEMKSCCSSVRIGKVILEVEWPFLPNRSPPHSPLAQQPDPGAQRRTRIEWSWPTPRTL